ncbi:MAG TPA: PAS domain S-box protein [Longimicrobiaceae bacterium]|nr:PAS domain S-box protein [Longimicrobiaceae bacterium]
MALIAVPDGRSEREIARHLHDAGYRVFPATSGRDGLTTAFGLPRLDVLVVGAELDDVAPGELIGRVADYKPEVEVVLCVPPSTPLHPGLASRSNLRFVTCPGALADESPEVQQARVTAAWVLGDTRRGEQARPMTTDGAAITVQCAYCLRYRNLAGSWAAIPDEFLADAEAVSHGVCPRCRAQMVERLSGPARLAALESTGLWSAPVSPALTRLTRLAANLLQVPVSQVTLIGADRQYVAARAGAPGEGAAVGLSHSVCQHVVALDRALVVSDAREHPLVRDNGAVKDDGVVAYAGVPLRTGDGEVLGAFCAIDHAPREWTAAELAILRDLAESVVTEIELRRELVRQAQTEELRTGEILDAIRDPFLVLDREGRIRYVNQAGAALLGRSRAMLRGEPFDEALAAVADADTAREVALIRSSGNVYDLRVASTGRWFAFQAHPTRDGMAVYGRDITLHASASGELGEAAAHFRALIENASDVITVLDQNGVIRYESPSVKRATGWEPIEMVGRNAFEYVHPDDLDRVRAVFAGLVAEPGAQCQMEFRFRRSDGSWCRFDCMGHNLLADDAVAGVVANLRDVTERQAAETALQESRMQLLRSQKMDAIGRMAAGMAHDFNNLLAVMKGSAELLLNDIPEGDPRRGDAKEIIAAANRGAKLIRQLLAFSRSQPMEPRPTALDALLENLGGMLRRLLGGGVGLSMDLAGGLPPVVVDPGQVEQAVVNLVVNARDALPRGGTVTIRTRLAALPSAAGRLPPDGEPGTPVVAVEVIDTGTGMDEDTLAQMYEPFFTTRPPERGSGLGLSIVYGIVHQSGGWIEVESAPGRGTRFSLYFPTTAQRRGSPT